VLQTQSAELVIFCKCNGIDPKIVEVCSKLTKTWLFFMDSYLISNTCPEIVEHAKRAHYSSCTSEITVDKFKQAGVEQCFHVFEGVIPTVHCPVEPMEKYRTDITLVGEETGERAEYYEFLKENKYDVKFYGSGWRNGYVEAEDWATVHSSAKMALSINTFNRIPTYFSGRVFETMGFGLCTLQLYTEGMENYFKHNENIVFFNDKQELHNILQKLTDEDIARIAFAGREKVLKSYTWFHSVEKILSIARVNI
jgi:spore maturation protein CgeB